MALRGIDTRAAIMKSGKAAFLECGFEGASLRDICANAGVTTGALYSNFKDKDALFCAIVEDDLSDYNELYDGLLGRLTAHVAREGDSERTIMDYVIEHRDLFKLLFDCAKGSSYESFKEDLLAKFDRTYQEFFDSYATEPVDPRVVQTVVRMKFAQYCEMIYSDFDRQTVWLITDRIGDFTKAGFEALLNVKFKSPG